MTELPSTEEYPVSTTGSHLCRTIIFVSTTESTTRFDFSSGEVYIFSNASFGRGYLKGILKSRVTNKLLLIVAGATPTIQYEVLIVVARVC